MLNLSCDKSKLQVILWTLNNERDLDGLFTSASPQRWELPAQAGAEYPSPGL